MQTIHNHDGSFIFHKVRRATWKGFFSAWFNAQGQLTDSEVIHSDGHRVATTDGQQRELQRLGQIWVMAKRAEIADFLLGRHEPIADAENGPHPDDVEFTSATDYSSVLPDNLRTYIPATWDIVSADVATKILTGWRHDEYAHEE